MFVGVAIPILKRAGLLRLLMFINKTDSNLKLKNYCPFIICLNIYLLFTCEVPFSIRYVACRSAKWVITAKGYLSKALLK